MIVRAVADLPSGDLVRRRGEKVLLRQAGHLDATELAKAAGTWSRWSTPTPSTAGSKPNWNARNVPPT